MTTATTCDDLLPIKAAAERLKTTVGTVRKWVRSGRLPATKTPNGEWRVSATAVATLPPARRGSRRFAKPKATLLFARAAKCHSLPTRGHPDDAGYDLYSTENRSFTAGETARVRTGVRVAVPVGHVGILHDRSSVAAKGLYVGGGVIDPGYTGEVEVILTNLSDRARQVKEGDKVCQLVVYRTFAGETVEVDDLPPTTRGEKGFGSTGR
jgi:dUTP pyrophosphatase